MNEAQTIPVVFISYSHESPDHKRWVAELARKLLENGVDVIFDQWDLSLGDDLVKFMEVSVTNAHRVLMICTEAYVRKADEGTGGVGYEAMIVTGELIRNLGTVKFIPVIRQGSNSPTLPKSLSTRFYVDLSDNRNFDQQFDLLLRELHKAPTFPKPTIGKNPFAKQPSGLEMPVDESSPEPIPDISKDDALAIYRTALDIARKGDLVAWRKIIRQAKQSMPTKMSEWRKKRDANPPKSNEELPEIAFAGLEPYASLFCIALAGVESGREKFNNQIFILDEVLNPRDWNYSGYTVLADFPDTSAFVYHLLHGAMCVETGQIDLAATFARSKVSRRYNNESIAIFQYHALTGWPTTLANDCTIAWNFINTLPEKWKWLDELFGDIRDYKSYLCGYYFVLNIMEACDCIASGKEELLQKNDPISLDVPLIFLRENPDIVRRGYQLLLNEPAQVRNIWKRYKISDPKLEELWPRWIYHNQLWLNRLHFYGSHTPIHGNLIKDLSS